MLLQLESIPEEVRAGEGDARPDQEEQGGVQAREAEHRDQARGDWRTAQVAEGLLHISH